MGALQFIRAMGALGLVLGLLAGALWIVKRYNIRLPGSGVGGSVRRVAIIERVGIDARRSVALVRRDGREHLLLLAPEGHVVIESGIIRDSIDQAATAAEETAASERAIAAQVAAAQAHQQLRAWLAMLATKLTATRNRFQALLVSNSVAPMLMTFRKLSFRILVDDLLSPPTQGRPTAPAPADRRARTRTKSAMERA